MFRLPSPFRSSLSHTHTHTYHILPPRPASSSPTQGNTCLAALSSLLPPSAPGVGLGTGRRRREKGEWHGTEEGSAAQEGSLDARTRARARAREWGGREGEYNSTNSSSSSSSSKKKTFFHFTPLQTAVHSPLFHCSASPPPSVRPTAGEGMVDKSGGDTTSGRF